MIAFLPITKPSSTSQSVWLDTFGITIGSLGPVIQLVNFENIIGSFGIGKFCSSAWSLKFSPMPINFDGLDTHAPILRFESNSGNLETSILLIFSKVSKFKLSGFKSSII